MNMFARFDEIPAMTLQDIKETKCHERKDGWTDECMDNMKTVNTVCRRQNDHMYFKKFF